jgi:cell division septation protein DedD
MSPDNREHEEPESYEVEPPRSIFSAMWFRVLLVVVALGVMAAVAVPYVLEWMSPPPVARPAPPAAPAPAPAVTAAPPPAPATTAPERKEPAPAALVAKPTPPAKSAGKAPARRPAKAVAKAPAATGAYYVQVGAFKDPEHAKKLAARLREAKFRVEESRGAPGSERAAAPAPVPAGAGDKYDVFIAGGPVAELSAKLAAKGLATQTSGNGVVVTPSLPLGDAVALSKDLATEGLRVQVRRAGGSAPAAATAAPAREPSAGGDTIHRVRVGPFADRAAAVEALNALKDKGYKDGFIARGGA